MVIILVMVVIMLEVMMVLIIMLNPLSPLLKHLAIPLYKKKGTNLV